MKKNTFRKIGAVLKQRVRIEHCSSGTSLRRKLRAVCFSAGVSLLSANQAHALPSFVGNGYCALRHPVESITSSRAACESQHVIQRQKDGGDDQNTIWINTTLHDYLDRSTEKPWELQRPRMSTFASSTLERAYMIGTYANGYHFYIYDHRDEGYTTLLAWDGVSHAVYAVSAIANLPSKEIGYLAYMVRHKLMRDKDTQLTDAVIGIAVDIVETSAGVLYSSVGVVTGTIFHPLDTVRNLIPAIPLIVSTLTVAVYGALINPIVVLIS